MATLTGYVANGRGFDRLFSVDGDDAAAVAQLDKAVLAEALGHKVVKVVWAANGTEQTLYEVFPGTVFGADPADQIYVLNRPGYGESFNANVGQIEGDDAVRISRFDVEASNYGVQTTSFGAITPARALLLARIYVVAARFAEEKTL